MKKLLILLIGLIVVLVVVFKFTFPKSSELKDISIQSNPEIIAHGEYLANNVMVCASCHSPRNFNIYAAPVILDSLYSGGKTFDEEDGFPGSITPGNLTPYFLDDYTDAELFRAITEGVSKEGKALFPVMPYLNYGKLPKEDIHAVIAYLRTLEPVSKDIPPTKVNFPLNIIMNFMPKVASHELKKDTTDIVAHGLYIATAAGCIDCHTPYDKGKPVKELEFAGGLEFKMPSGGKVYSANITPDEETGIGYWNEATFVRRFKHFTDSGYQAIHVNKGDINTEMPWAEYAEMKESDLKALYAYLNSLDPIEHRVERFIPD